MSDQPARSKKRIYRTKHGPISTMQTENIGQPRLAASDSAPDVAQPDKPASVPEPSAEQAEPVRHDDARAAPPPDPHALDRAAVRDAIRGLRNLNGVDFGSVVASMSIEELREARDEEDGALDILFAWSAALDEMIERATSGEEQMPPAA